MGTRKIEPLFVVQDSRGISSPRMLRKINTEEISLFNAFCEYVGEFARSIDESVNVDHKPLANGTAYNLRLASDHLIHLLGDGYPKTGQGDDSIFADMKIYPSGNGYDVQQGLYFERGVVKLKEGIAKVSRADFRPYSKRGLASLLEHSIEDPGMISFTERTDSLHDISLMRLVRKYYKLSVQYEALKTPAA
jgi:hypothetical protein